MKIIEQRTITRRALCDMLDSHNWCNKLTVAQYHVFVCETIDVKNNLTVTSLRKIANFIQKHTDPAYLDGYDTCGIMFELCNKSISTFGTYSST